MSRFAQRLKSVVGFMSGFLARRSMLQRDEEGPLARRTRARRSWSIVRDKVTGQFRFRTDGRNEGTRPGHRHARRLALRNHAIAGGAR